MVIDERNAERGFSLVEMIVAIALAGSILGSLVAAMTVQGRSASYQRGLADAQLTSRAVGYLLQQDLRMAGYGMLGLSDGSDLQPLTYQNTGGTQEIFLRGAFADVRETLQEGVLAGASSIPVPLGANFVLGELVLIDSGLHSETRQVVDAQVLDGFLWLDLEAPLEVQYPLGTKVVQIEEVVWALEAGVFRRNGEVMADNVEEFQLDFVSQEGIVASLPGANLRAVQIHLRTMQTSGLPDEAEASSILQTEVNVRNMAFHYQIG